MNEDWRKFRVDGRDGYLKAAAVMFSKASGLWNQACRKLIISRVSNELGDEKADAFR
jgi:hypothetical protein